jgi:hypothetical protein
MQTLYPQKMALTSPTFGGRSVSIVRLRTKSHGVFVSLCIGLKWNRVHYYCGHLLSYFTGPVWQMVMIVEHLVK